MDVIDERNRKAKLAKMVIKRRNVIYTVPQEEKKEEDSTDILARLEQENKNKEAKKRMEIDHLVEEQERKQMEEDHILNEKNVIGRIDIKPYEALILKEI